MSASKALRWFLDDAKRQGLSLVEYERKYGIILDSGKYRNAATQRISRHEVSGGTMTEDEYRLVLHKEKRRSPETRAALLEMPDDECE